MNTITVAPDLALKPLQQGDAKSLFTLIQANRSHLRRWLTWVDANTELDHTRRFIESALAQAADHLGPTYAIWASDAIAGVIGYHPIDRANASGPIGYWLAEAFTGRGIMTRSCSAVLSHGFDTLRLNRVSISAAVNNRKSRAIAERLGFRQKAVIRNAELLHDSHVDHALYVLQKDEWKHASEF